MADGIGLDLGDLAFGITERTQGIGNSAVDDLEVAATGKLLELHQREVGFDAGRVAIHHEADRAGRRDNGGLGVAVAVLFAEFQRLVPGGSGVGDEVLIRAIGMDEGNRVDRQAFITIGQTMGGAAVVADDAQHVVAVRRKAGEGAKLAGHFSRGGVGNARHDRGQRTGNGAAFVAVIGNARRHQEAADIGVTEAERAVFVGAFGNLARGELRHHDGHFENDGPQAHGMFVIGDVDALRCLILELQQVQRGKVAGRVVEEHVFRARVRSADRAFGRRGVPVVHGGVEVQAGVGRCPGGVGNLFPEIARLQRLHDLAVLAGGEVPVAVIFDGTQEVILQRNGVVGVLARHREIGFGIPIRVIGLELDVLVTLFGELDDALDVVFRHHVLLGSADFALQGRVLGRVEAVTIVSLAVDAGLHDRLKVLGDDLGAGDESGNLLLLVHLPVDIGFDIRVVSINNDHLRRTAGGAAGLDGAGCAVTDLEEAHQAGGLAAAGELFAFATQIGEVGAGAGAVFEQARFTHPQVHDAAFIDQIVFDGLDEAGMRLRMFVSGFGLGQLAGEGVDIEVALAGAVNAIGPVQAGVEPLRAVGGDALGGEHVGKLVAEGECIFFGREIFALPAPIGPGAGQTVENLTRIGLGAVTLGFGQLFQGFLIGNRTPQEGRNIVFLDLLQHLRHAGLAEIFLRQNIRGDLRKLRGNVDIRQTEHDGSIRVLDFTDGLAEFDFRVRRLAGLREAAFNAHGFLSSSIGRPVKGAKIRSSRANYARSRLLPFCKGCSSLDVIPVSRGLFGCKHRVEY